MVAIDGVGFDWSYMAEDEVPTNMDLMAFSDSEIYTNNTCLKTCLKSYKTFKKKYDDLRVEFNKFEFVLATYKRGLASVEEQVVFYKKNEVIFYEQIVVLKRDLSYGDSEIMVIKSLDKLIGSQITDKSRKGVGFESYNTVPPPPTRLFSPPNIDLSYSGLEEFKQPEFESYGPKACKIESKNASENIPNELKESTKVKESSDVLLVKKFLSDDKLEKKTVVPTDAKIEFDQYTVRLKPVNTARPNSAVVNAVMVNKVNAVKAPAWEEQMVAELLVKELFTLNAINDEPKSSCDDGNKDGNGVNKDSRIDTHEKFANSINDVNTVRLNINTACTDFDTGSLNINIISPTVYAASPKATHADFLAKIEAIRLFLAYASFMGYMVYQMDVKSAFLYERIKDEVYVCQPPGFEDLDHPDKVYKVVKVLYGLHQAPRAYVKTASTLVDTLVKDTDGDDIDTHLYRSMIGSLMYLTTSRPDIMYEETEEFKPIISLFHGSSLTDKLTKEQRSGDDLVMLWSLVKERFNSTEPTDDKERELWVKLKRLFELDTNDKLSKSQNDSLLLTPLFCDDINDVTPHVSALAGCDRLDEDEPLEHEASDKEVDSDLESTGSSKPMMKKTTKADPDRASCNCLYYSK
nr:putative ribonuclease H-like domain-containing protein [Tanacetum cinerariifolium]